MSTDTPTSTAYLGIDVSRDELACCLVLSDGSRASPGWVVANDPAGMDALVRQTVELVGQHSVGQLLLGMEASGLYWWHPACLLVDSPALQPFEAQVYALNPRVVRGFERACSPRSKTDPNDAHLIAERLRFGQLPAPFRVDPAYAPLQRLTRYRKHVADNLVREKCYYLSLLTLSYSAYCQQRPLGTHPLSATGIAVLEEFTAEQVAAMPIGELTEFVQRAGHGKFKQPQQVAAKLKQAASDSYELPEHLAEPVKLVLQETLGQIRRLQAQLARLDKLVEKQLAQLPEHLRTIRSIPGLGGVYTAGIVAELGDVTRFPDDAAIAKYAGLWWPARESGSYQAQDTPMSKAGNEYLRYHLVEAANSVRLHCAEYQQYYAAKHAQSTKHAHKRAVVLTARKLVRLIDELLRAGKVIPSPQPRREAGMDPAAYRQTRQAPGRAAGAQARKASGHSGDVTARVR
ncbi:MAG: IS110 family transposase [Chloroflexota bacterium]|nr:IS110 family transposase [Chloroflexota bacterium]